VGGRVRPKRAPQLDFQVSEEIITQSIPKDSSHCMIADALAQAMPNAKYISVDLATIRFTDLAAGWRYIYLTPRIAQEALVAFDQGERPEPFRVQSRAAHMVATGTAQKARKEPGQGRRRTELVKEQGNGTVPLRVGGQSPPVGPLSNGATGGPRTSGRRREFGLRAFIK
jgi:hypothetical protein